MAALGTTANNYEILSKLAEGGMAELFLARVVGGNGLRRHVVLKRIARERATDTQFVQMFLDEARLAAQLRHPNIAQVFDIGRLGVSYFFTMEYVHGVTVQDLVTRAADRRTVLPVHAVLGIIAGTAAGLQHAHDRAGADGKPLDIVHRDISPSNLMLSYDGQVKVVDFGVAKAALVGRPETQAGEIKGKVGYLSPEQCRLQKLDRRSDLYSLGVVAWEMLTGKRLWKRETAFGTMAAIATEEVPLASEYREDLWPEVDALVAKLLATEVAERFQDAAELIEAVELVAATTKSNITPPQLARMMRDLFGAPVEPWLVPELPQAVAVTATPVPAELDTHDGDDEGGEGESIDTVEHKLTSVFSAVPAEDSTTNLVAMPSDRLSTASGARLMLPSDRLSTADGDRAISQNEETREVPALARGVPQRPSTEILPPAPRASSPPRATELLALPEMPTQRDQGADPARTIIGAPLVPAPVRLSHPPTSPPPMRLSRMPPSGDPTVPLGTQLPSQPIMPSSGARMIESGPRIAPSGPAILPEESYRPSNAPLPRFPPPPHGNLSTLRWWLVGGALLGVVILVLVLVSRSESSRRVVAPAPVDSVVIVATTPDATEDAAAIASDTQAEADAAEPEAAPAASDAALAATADAPVDVAEPDEMEELDKPMPTVTPRKKKLRTKAELNAAFRERRYKDIVVACTELGADGDLAVVCTLAACRARDGHAQDWYRNVPPNKRDGTINICRQAGAAIKDVCATDLLSCRK
ncbi:MAG: serine/threonine protein kinase [Deltaproteobacteria bacterium]|nr:serine/threonine protein kinase [Deltaproteobacteria bacterium]